MNVRNAYPLDEDFVSLHLLGQADALLARLAKLYSKRGGGKTSPDKATLAQIDTAAHAVLGALANGTGDKAAVEKRIRAAARHLKFDETLEFAGMFGALRRLLFALAVHRGHVADPGNNPPKMYERDDGGLYDFYLGLRKEAAAAETAGGEAQTDQAEQRAEDAKGEEAPEASHD